MSKILSLCSGYGGLDLAVEEHFTGSHTAYWSDIDPSACDIMTARFPDAEPVGDLTQFGDTAFDCDILTAGYPCQPFSHAGKRLGEDDERHLWPYIANTIGVSRPRWVILENVAGHVNLGGPAVVGTLTEMGYSVRWGVVRAFDAGAPHQRKRLFIVANASSERHGGRQDVGLVAELDRGEKKTTQQRQRSRKEFVYRGTTTTNTNSEGLEGQRTQHELREASEETDTAWSSYARAIQRWEQALGRPAEFRECLSETNWGEYGTAINRWEHILGRSAPPPVEDNKLSASFVEWMMGLEKNWVCGVVESRAKALKVLGNGVVKQQARLALELICDE